MIYGNRFRLCVKYAFFIVLLGVLAGCAEELDQLFSKTLSGSVGDGPVTHAQIWVTDANGNIIGATISDISANYSVKVPAGSVYPIMVSASNGTDVVTGAAPDFTMVSVAMDSSVSTVNINPFSTLIVKTANALPGGLTAPNLGIASQFITGHLSFGLDGVVMPKPINTVIDAANVATIIKASEALGETIRRTRSALQNSGNDILENEIISVIAADMTDGVLDGLGVGSNAKIAAVFNAVSAQVLVESLGNHLNVGGADATERMDFAINLSMRNATMTTGDVLISNKMLTQTRNTVTAAQTLNGNLSAVALVLAGVSGNSLAADIDTLLPIDVSVVFDEVIAQVALGSDSEFELVNESVRAGNTGSTPVPTPTPTPVPTPATVPGVFEFATAEYSVGESDGTVSININRLDGNDGIATVEWRTITFSGYGTADWANDYGTFLWQPLTFADGQTSMVKTISIHPDSVVEGDETFSVLLRSPAGGAAQIGNNSTTVVTIIDDVSSIPAPAPTPIVPPVIPPSGTIYPEDVQLTKITPSSISWPGYLTPILDPTFGTKVTRVTDNAVFGATNVRHAYSKNAVWNSDGTLIKTKTGYLLDGNTYQRVGKFSAPGEVVWSNLDANKVFNMNGLQFRSINVLTNQATVLRTFTGYEQCLLGSYEGNIAIDDSVAAFQCKNGSNMTAIVYDIRNNTIESTKTFSGKWADTDWVSVSQSGTYVVISWRGTGRGVDVYDRNINHIVRLSSDSAHGDLGYDTQGNEVFLQWFGVSGAILTTYRLFDGKATLALDKSVVSRLTDEHISCRNIKRKGWCYISVYGSNNVNEIFALKLDGSQTVERFVHHRSTNSSYDRLPMAVPNSDGTKVMFASDWGGSQINSYVVELP